MAVNYSTQHIFTPFFTPSNPPRRIYISNEIDGIYLVTFRRYFVQMKNKELKNDKIVP